MRQSLIIIISILLSNVSYTQIYGNGKLFTATRTLGGLEEIDIQFNADITLNYNAIESMTITAEENIMEYIGQEFNNGKLTLDQIRWIEPSKNPTIVIGTPNLKKIFQGTHSSTYITNMKSNKIWITGNVGKVFVEGSCQKVRINVSGTDVDLSKTKVGFADITIDGSSTVILDKVNTLNTKLDRNANLVLKSEPNEYLDDSEKETKEKKSEYKPNPELKYISFKIKNNSWSRNHFIVVGPKKDGGTFSYGFPMMPGTSKSEKWSVGTKIYKEGSLGNRKLLVTITSKDEGQLVKLF